MTNFVSLKNFSSFRKDMQIYVRIKYEAVLEPVPQSLRQDILFPRPSWPNEWRLTHAQLKTINPLVIESSNLITS